MTFHFAHMAPPGAAPLRRPALSARWGRCSLTQRLVMLRDRPVIPSAIPEQPEPLPATPARPRPVGRPASEPRAA